MNWTYQQAQIGLDYDILTGDAQVVLGVHFVDEESGDISRQGRFVDLQDHAALRAAAAEGFDVFCDEARSVLGEWFDRWPVTAHMAWYDGVQAIQLSRPKR